MPTPRREPILGTREDPWGLCTPPAKVKEESLTPQHAFNGDPAYLRTTLVKRYGYDGWEAISSDGPTAEHGKNLIRLIVHCDSGFRAPNNLSPGAVDMVALNSEPRFRWRFFGLQWKEISPMFAVLLAVGSQLYAQRPGTVAQWMAAVESIWLADRRGFFGVEMLPGDNYQQGADLVVVILRYVYGGNAAGSAKTSVNFRFSCELNDTRRDWAAMEAKVGRPAVVTVLPGDRDYWMRALPQTIKAANLQVWWATSRGKARYPVRGTIP
ncbi:hypothetical protein FN846DRAFT_994079 [Sphaerosporella brunnea]|uniref:Uncharacterized protein n=1 Tax=Sphaerosporella brunnea TaxID=1250544 RepID=A0A5J5F7V5_9PEZI|nr:hypothetical protein FN846DRAFT_994079 [Sphaerosporella brunnea]